MKEISNPIQIRTRSSLRSLSNESTLEPENNPDNFVKQTFGHYQVVERLGSGSFGYVYSCLDLNDNSK